MAMKHYGLAKLVEECGEVAQVAGKLLQYPESAHTGYHPDGTDLRERMEDELADIQAACLFVGEAMQLNRERIGLRLVHKLGLFRQWAQES